MEPQNPYAAPRANSDLQASSGGPVGIGPQPWEIGEVISQSWQLFKENWGLLLGTGLVGYIAIIIAQQVIGAVFGFGALRGGGAPDVSKLVTGVLVQTVLGQLVQAFVQVGWIRVWLGIVRGENPTFSTFLSGGSRYVPMLLTTLLVVLGTLVGMVFLVVPGVIVALGLFFAQYFVADSEMGVMDAVKASWDAMNGQKASVFMLGLVLGFLNIAGAIACFVGLLATVPMSFLAFAIVFTRITGRTSSATAEGSIPGLVQG